MATQGYNWKILNRGELEDLHHIVQQQGSVEPYLNVQLLKPDGDPLPLNNFQWVALVVDGFEKTWIGLNVTDANQGIAQLAWNVGNIDKAGGWDCEFQAVNASGGFLNFGNGILTVEPTL